VSSITSNKNHFHSNELIQFNLEEEVKTQNKKDITFSSEHVKFSLGSYYTKSMGISKISESTISFTE